MTLGSISQMDDTVRAPVRRLQRNSIIVCAYANAVETVRRLKAKD